MVYLIRPHVFFNNATVWFRSKLTFFVSFCQFYAIIWLQNFPCFLVGILIPAVADNRCDGALAFVVPTSTCEWQTGGSELLSNTRLTLFSLFSWSHTHQPTSLTSSGWSRTHRITRTMPDTRQPSTDSTRKRKCGRPKVKDAALCIKHRVGRYFTNIYLQLGYNNGRREEREDD
jgi:hypothetical protein